MLGNRIANQQGNQKQPVRMQQCIGVQDKVLNVVVSPFAKEQPSQE